MAGLPYDQLLQNLIRQESGGKANALSHAGAAGIMQVMPGTAREIAAEIGDNSLNGMNDQQIQQALMDPARGRRYGEHYLQKMLNRYGGDQAAALVAYNGGPGRADAWLKSGRNDAVIPAETRNYYRSILGENIPMSGGAGADMLAGGGGSDAMATTGSGGAAGSPFEGASDRQKWATWLSALGQSFRGRDNSESMQRLDALEQQGVSANKTYQALVKRGIDPATAEWAVRDPQVMREVAQQLFAPKSKNMTISEIFDPATGRPVKVLVDQTTGEYQPIGGVSAPDPTKAPNLQAIDVFDEATGRKRKAVFNPTTGQMEPLGGIEAASGDGQRRRSKGLDGRMYYEDTGEPVFAEGHPANTAVNKQTLPAQAITKTIDADAAVRNLSAALDEFENLVTGQPDDKGNRSGGTGYAFTGVERSSVGTALEGIKMAMKDAYELGALTGPDVVVLENMLVDPRTSWTSTFNPWDGERGLGGVIGNTIGQTTGAADTGIKQRVSSNVRQVKAEFERRLKARMEALKAQYSSGAPASPDAPATDFKRKYGLE